MPAHLELPDVTERLLLAADYAGLTPRQIRDGLTAIGVTTSEKYIYKLTTGELKEPPRRIIAGLASVLGTDARWFCEPDEDGVLEAELVAGHARRGSVAAELP